MTGTNLDSSKIMAGIFYDVYDDKHLENYENNFEKKKIKLEEYLDA